MLLWPEIKVVCPGVVPLTFNFAFVVKCAYETEAVAYQFLLILKSAPRIATGANASSTLTLPSSGLYRQVKDWLLMHH
jgi:hypothetical protein